MFDFGETNYASIYWIFEYPFPPCNVIASFLIFVSPLAIFLLKNVTRSSHISLDLSFCFVCQTYPTSLKFHSLVNHFALPIKIS